jgi:hypothetical protein
MPEVLQRFGYEDWMREDAHVELLDALRARMGVERVGFSQEGFNLL